ncbi:50S ribosomal protein L22 [Patescibacteria group bacterium]|nr:50S ribosomal protein L22 [Patescibacteria group bacterium]MBU1876965.1 50S ribosomal protein L22 [Patescibacteria group bacterium]
MEVKAQLNYLRIAPRKVRLIADLIRGKTVEQAQNILRFTIKKGVDPMVGLLKSATFSATNNFHLLESNLYIAKISVNEGPKLKRWRARARGSAFEIQKKTSHIVIVLDEKEKSTKKGKDGKTSVKKHSSAKDASFAEVASDTKAESKGKEKSKQRVKEIEREIQKPKTTVGARKSFIRQKTI